MALTIEALTTVRRAKIALGIPHTTIDYDEYLEDTINTVSAEFSSYCNRIFYVRSYIEQHSGNARQWMALKQRPIIGIPTVVNDGVDIPDFDVYAQEGMLFRDGSWPDGALLMYRGLQAGDRHPWAVRYNMTVYYVAGYFMPDSGARTLPYDLERSLFLELGKNLNKRLAEGFQRQRTSGYLQVEYYMGDFLPETKKILDMYKT